MLNGDCWMMEKLRKEKEPAWNEAWLLKFQKARASRQACKIIFSCQYKFLVFRGNEDLPNFLSGRMAEGFSVMYSFITGTTILHLKALLNIHLFPVNSFGASLLHSMWPVLGPGETLFSRGTQKDRYSLGLADSPYRDSVLRKTVCYCSCSWEMGLIGFFLLL